MTQTRQSKQHLFNIYDTMLYLDTNEKGILQHAFFCESKEKAKTCRNNITNTISKGVLKHRYKTELINAVNEKDEIFWFCIVKRT